MIHVKKKEIKIMAHDLEFRDNEYSFVENTKENISWHGLGKQYKKPLTAAEAIEGCRANYNVSKRHLANLTEDQINLINSGMPVTIEKSQIVENWNSITREDNHYTLGVVKDRYEIVQNAQAFEFIDYLTTGELGTKASIDAAGVLGKGERIFITAKFNDSVKINKNDLIDLYAVFTNSFDGTSAVCCMITPVRVVCNNTLNFAFRHNNGRFNLRHTKSIQSKILINEENMHNAVSCLGILDKYKITLHEGIEKFGNIKINEQSVDKIIMKTIAHENLLKTLENINWNINSDEISTRFRNNFLNIKDAIYNGVGQKNQETNNGLWLINGFTTAFQNSIQMKNQERKFNSLMTGSYYKSLNKAVSLVNELA